jgi:iron(II)-dependent oxidoreductase
MAYVPAGKFLMGTKNVDDFRFYYKDFIPMHEVELAGYHIDKHPVTNEQYKNFLQFINQNGHVCCHPDEDPNRDHTAAHIRDPRFNQDDMPVTGIDWYDAYAYAAYAGKKLPTDEQWEKAARGTEGQQYPWGNDWQPEHAHYAESCFNAEINNLDEWEDVLRNYSGVYPRKTVVANNAIAGNVSPYGVYDMVGNVWEWTRTNYFTRKHMDPFFKGRDQADFMNRASAFAVIRGGCFTSLPEMLRTYYRGKDLLTDRHCEIGFRCVSEDE